MVVISSSLALDLTIQKSGGSVVFTAAGGCKGEITNFIGFGICGMFTFNSDIPLHACNII